MVQTPMMTNKYQGGSIGDWWSHTKGLVIFSLFWDCTKFYAISQFAGNSRPLLTRMWLQCHAMCIFPDWCHYGSFRNHQPPPDRYGNRFVFHSGMYAGLPGKRKCFCLDGEFQMHWLINMKRETWSYLVALGYCENLELLERCMVEEFSSTYCSK